MGEFTWASGIAYESYVGRWSRLVARDFVRWLSVAPGAVWLDVGCGTGALTEAIAENASPRSVVGIDRSAGYVEHATEQNRDERIRYLVGDAASLPFSDASFDAVVSGLVLNFVPDPALMVAEMRRVANDAGTVGVYVWDYAENMQLIRYFWDAATALNPAAAALDEGRRFPICQPERLRDLFSSVGFVDVHTRGIDIPTRFADFEDLWTPFLSGEAPAPGYVRSLDPGEREALRRRLRRLVQPEGEGPVSLRARAWALQARRDSRARPPIRSVY